MTLGVALVVTVNYEEHNLTLRQVIGSDQEFQRVPVPITYPAAGARHGILALPEEGDYCIIGHLAQETDGRTTTPVVLGWILPGTWMGHDWMVSQPFAPDEWSFDPKDSHFVSGRYKRKRHKLRHLNPGNIVLSSSQGSDIVLDEGVALLNRRCNEIRLRDADQALVIRALQHFEALGGVRMYSGQVQRDATYLPTQMFSDGVDWAGPRQINVSENRPFTDEELREFASSHPQGFLTSNPVFDRLQADGTLNNTTVSGLFLEPNIDPYDFLQQGLFVTSQGTSFDKRVQSDAVYGGKPMFRASVVSDNGGTPLNALIGFGDQARSFTEHRVEVSHTHDGRLPVSEQTDGFDADRLPRSSPGGVDQLGRSTKAPFIESVLGTVIGNDAFNRQARETYGVPLRPVVFDSSGAPAPSMESAANSDLDDQAATLFRLFPPTVQGGPPSFTSYTKDGRFFASIGGPLTKAFSAEVNVRSGLHLAVGGLFQLDLAKGLQINVPNGDVATNYGLNMGSSNAAVRIYGGGNTTEGSLAARTAPAGGGEADLPSVLVEGRNNVTIKAARRILSNAQDISVRGNNYENRQLSGISMSAGDRIGLSSKTFDHVVNGKATIAYHGPKDFLPTNGPHRETTFTGIALPTADKLTIFQGDREEDFLILGNHRTTTTIGNLTYETLLGIVTHTAGTNSLAIDSITGMTGSVPVGNITFDATAGAITASGQVSITLRSSGPAVLSGASGVTLGGPGKVGGIVSGADLDPLTGAPLATLGLGSPGHNLGPPV